MNKIKGFTLIELLIVIAIILILIAIALPNFLEAQIRARIAAVKGDLRTIDIAMNSYYLDFGVYPPDHDPDSLTSSSSGLFQLTSPIAYITELPEDKFRPGGSGVGTSNELRWFEMGSSGVPPIMAAMLKDPFGTFAVYSSGPDGEEEFADNDSFPYAGETPPCPSNIGYLNYSPTNGTKSRGDLVQVGGNVNAGYYCIDRWRTVSGFRPRP